MNSLESKKQEVAYLKENFQNIKSAVVTDYRGLSVAELTELRSQLREAGVEFKVTKNTLLKIAAKEAGIEGLDEFFKGPTAVAYGLEDAVAPAQILSKFAKEHENLEIKAGLLDGEVISLEEINALADLPPKEILLTQLAGLFQAPMVGFANVLQGPIRKMGYALEALRTKEQEA